MERVRIFLVACSGIIIAAGLHSSGVLRLDRSVHSSSPPPELAMGSAVFPASGGAIFDLSSISRQAVLRAHKAGELFRGSKLISEQDLPELLESNPAASSSVVGAQNSRSAGMPSPTGQAFVQSDHGGNGNLPDVPTITHYGVSGPIFFWTVEGPTGAEYFLEISTDLRNWDNLGVDTTTGTANQPSGFVFLSEVGERFYLRIGPP